MSPPSARPGESGVALLVVLLAITLLTIVVVEFTYSAQVETHLALGARNALQAYYLARSGVNVAELAVAADALLPVEAGGRSDSAHDVWATPLPPLTVGDGTVMLRVRDEARWLDVNTLAKPGGVSEMDPTRAVFKGLFNTLRLEPALLAAVIDWLDADEDPERSPVGAEQAYYLRETPPVRVPNGPIDSLDALLAVRGMTPEILGRLAEFITAIPDPERDTTIKVNINTAPAEVLRALPALAAKPAIVEQIISAQAKGRFDDDADLQHAVPLLGNDATLRQQIGNQITFDSAYFRIEAVGTVGGITRGITTIVRRGGANRRPEAVTRVSWSPRIAKLALTSLPPSDFLEALPPLGGG